MRRFALKKNLNYPLAIKLFKKRKNISKTIFRSICHMVHLLKTFENCANTSVLIKSKILTTKLRWWKTKG